MLYQFLKTIQTEKAQSVLEIARSMNISANMALQIADDLTSKGYLQEFGRDCDDPKYTCSDCPVNTCCQVIARHWFLTDKGINALSGKVT
jgi:hypothetical protein